jgi:hypothetical protein
MIIIKNFKVRISLKGSKYPAVKRMTESSPRLNEPLENSYVSGLNASICVRDKRLPWLLRCWPGEWKRADCIEGGNGKAGYTINLFKHLFRKNEGCGASICSLKYLVLCLVRNEPISIPQNLSPTFGFKYNLLFWHLVIGFLSIN